MKIKRFLNNKMTRFIIALVLALSTLGMSISTGLADTPVKYEYRWTPVNTLSGVCSFDVTVNSTVNFTEIDFYNQDGQLIATHLHGVEQDTFIANGKALVGETFPVYVRLIFDSNGVPTQIIGAGIMEKIQLPSGSFFLSAGMVNFLAHPGDTYVLSPDKGNPGNLADFCAALSQ